MELKRGYKRTEMGIIPVDWDVKPLSSLAGKIMVGIASAATHAYRINGVPLFRNQNIKAGYLDDGDVLYIDPEYEKTYRNKRLQGGDLLTARTGYPGTTCVVPSRYESAQSFTTLITRPNTTEIDSSFLCIYINSEAGQKFFEQGQIGGAQKNVNAGTLRKMPVPIPSPPEQRAIATALSDADAWIESLEQLIAKKRQIKQGAMQELLTGKRRLPGYEVKRGFKKTEVGVIPEDWAAIAIGQVGYIYTGNTPSTAISENYGDDYLFASPIDLGSSKYVMRTAKMLSSRGFAIARQVPSDAILFVCIGSTIGKCGIAGTRLATNQQINSVVAFHATYSEFLYYALCTAALRVKSQAGEQAVPIVNKSQFADTLIPLPPTLAEQEAIATNLSDMDAEIDMLATKLTKARQIKQGMMQELLTGRIRLI